MIKRRFYKLDRGDQNDQPSESSSSSSSSEFLESEAEAEAEAESEAAGEESQAGDEGTDAWAQLQHDAEACSTSSGYETEDSSANEVDIDSSGLPINDEDDESGDELPVQAGSRFRDKQSENMEENEGSSTVFPACVLKSKSVFRCRLCPRIVCLNEESMMAHLKSKRHSRSEKLLDEGRLKATLNSDGEIDNEDTPTREKVQTAAVSQDKHKRKKGGRQRQHRRRQNKKLEKKKVEHDADAAKKMPIKETPAKKKRKHEK